MGYIKNKLEEARSRHRQTTAANKIIKAKARAAYLKESETQAVRVAESKAKIQADRKIESYKSGGFFGAVGRATAPPRNASPVRRTYNAAPKRRSKSRKKRSTYKRRASRPPQKRSTYKRRASRPPQKRMGFGDMDFSLSHIKI